MTRVMMLETLRVYGCEQLVAEGEAEAARDRHAAYYVALADEVQRHQSDATEQPWYDRLERERDNVRAALRWLEARGDTATALRLAAALYGFWLDRGPLDEGRRCLETLLEASAGASSLVPATVRAEALNGAGVLAGHQGDFARSQEWFERALETYRAMGDVAKQAKTMGNLGTLAVERGDFGDAATLLDGAIALYRDLDEPRALSSLA